MYSNYTSKMRIVYGVLSGKWTRSCKFKYGIIPFVLFFSEEMILFSDNFLILRKDLFYTQLHPMVRTPLLPVSLLSFICSHLWFFIAFLFIFISFSFFAFFLCLPGGGEIEYTNWILRTNCRGSSSGTLECVKYSLRVITPRWTQTQNGSTS